MPRWGSWECKTSSNKPPLPKQKQKQGKRMKWRYSMASTTRCAVSCTTTPFTIFLVFISRTLPNRYQYQLLPASTRTSSQSPSSCAALLPSLAQVSKNYSVGCPWHNHQTETFDRLRPNRAVAAAIHSRCLFKSCYPRASPRLFAASPRCLLAHLFQVRHTNRNEELAENYK